MIFTMKTSNPHTFLAKLIIPAVQAVMSAVVKYGPLVAICHVGKDFYAYDKGFNYDYSYLTNL